MGLFSTLLGGTATGEAAVTASASQSLDLNLLGLAGLSLDAGINTGGEAGEDAIAAALDLNLGAVAPPRPAPLVDLIDALAAIKVNLDQGGPVDPALLDQLNSAMQSLAQTLGIDLDGGADAPDFTALLGASGKAEAGFGPLLEALDIDLTLRAAADGAVKSLGPQLQAAADKLASLLGQMANGAVSADVMAKLGLADGAVVDADVQAALNRLSAGVVLDTDQVPAEPDLATPALKVTEPVLTGKDAQTEAAARPAAPASDDGTATDGKEQKSSPSAAQAVEAKADEPAKPAERPSNEPNQRAVGTVTAAPVEEATVDPTAPQNTAQTSLRVEAVAPRVVQAGYQTSQQQLNLPQIAFELARQVTDGNTRFQIRLDPPELGRIDVRLDIDKAGQVNARLMVEKAETLDLMQRDQRGLERALQQAGIDSGKTNLEFSLKQNPFAGQNAGQDQQGEGRQAAGTKDGDADGVEDAPAPTVNLYRGALQARGVNIIA